MNAKKKAHKGPRKRKGPSAPPHEPRVDGTLMQWSIGPRFAGEGLSRFLREKLDRDDLSMRDLKAYLEQGLCRVNGQIERFASRKLRSGDRLSFLLPNRERVKVRIPPLTRERILYEDADLVVIDKPAGVSVTARSDGPSLPELLGALAESVGANKLLPAHRLDRDTSGALILARDGKTRDALFEMFKEREVLKAYEALTHGHFPSATALYSSRIAKLGEDGGQGRWGSVKRGGLEAVTEVRRLAAQGGLSHLRVFPRTGRSHQIRVHLSEAGHPVLGDALYGRNAPQTAGIAPPRHMLHARGLIFAQPRSGAKVAIEAPYPEDFRELIPGS